MKFEMIRTLERKASELQELGRKLDSAAAIKEVTADGWPRIPAEAVPAMRLSLCEYFAARMESILSYIASQGVDTADEARELRAVMAKLTPQTKVAA